MPGRLEWGSWGRPGGRGTPGIRPLLACGDTPGPYRLGWRYGSMGCVADGWTTVTLGGDLGFLCSLGERSLNRLASWGGREARGDRCSGE